MPSNDPAHIVMKSPFHLFVSNHFPSSVYEWTLVITIKQRVSFQINWIYNSLLNDLRFVFSFDNPSMISLFSDHSDSIALNLSSTEDKKALHQLMVFVQI